ncbi:MBOAT family O-acyltransferase [Desulfogranum marinum]|uniref:MBOAT family O-acyltransferase n=1 Tax=Desulfogranum marinum TaxID=453220 RepID=UPI001964057C|nr:MBOAT family O-acyltransferase [Desulfogranum marinum]MBM9513034.1 MBOAT family protein [Desulfogranum marinum]
MQYTLVLLASIFITYIFGYLLKDKTKYSVFLLFLGISCNVFLLVYFKYSSFFFRVIGESVPFFAEVHQSFVVNFENVHLPLGISFFVFQAISYLIDVYRQDSPVEKNPLNVALYIAMFPQLVAGPIVRFNSIAKELSQRTISWDKLTGGVSLFVVGLSQKVLIANTVAVAVDGIYNIPLAEMTAPLAWIAAVGYALQIYFDFTGYSNMAIGLGLIFGFHFPANFNYPYWSQSITEFWRRWHMSLSRWFKDYLYIPLGGNRHGKLRTYFNLWVVFLLCGLWHGASWNFILWGAFHGALLVLERAGVLRVINQCPRLIRHLYCLFFVLICWVPFRAETLEQSVTIFRVMFFGSSASSLNWPVASFVSNDVALAFIFGIIFSAPLWQFLQEKLFSVKTVARHTVLYQTCSNSIVVLLFFLCILSLSSGAHNPFIYFQF